MEKNGLKFLSEGLHDKMIGKISSPDRPVAVVEWSEASRGFLTSVNSYWSWGRRSRVQPGWMHLVWTQWK